MNIGYKTDAENVKRQALIDLMKDMPLSILQISFIYAKNYTEYGEDVTRTWLTVTENVGALEKAYRKGYYEALQRQVELDKIRAEIHATAEMHDDGNYYLRDRWIDEIFDKYTTSDD